jgi:hypothetical protein
MDLAGSGHSVMRQGAITNDSTLFIQPVTKPSNRIEVWKYGIPLIF